MSFLLPIFLATTSLLISNPIETSQSVKKIDAAYYAKRSHLTPAARVKAAAVETEFSTNGWAGTDGVDVYATDQVAVGSADLVAKFAALDPSLHHRIRLSSSGDWTSTEPYFFNQDFLTNGGSCRIEPETGTGPVLSTRVRVAGVRGLHFNNVTFGHYVYIFRASYAAGWAVVRFEGCRAGATFRGEAAYANYHFMVFDIRNVEEVQIINCDVDGSQAGIVSSGTRRLRVDGVDFQRLGADCVNPKGTDATIADENFATYWPDMQTYVWVNGCTARNYVDDPVIGSVHSDFIQFDTAGTGVLDYNFVIEFCAVNIARDQITGVGTQGVFTNNEVTSLNGVVHSNIIGITAYNTLSAYGDGVPCEYFFEHNTCVRASRVEVSVDNLPWITASGALTTVWSTNNIAAFYHPNDSTFTSNGDVIADPMVGSSAPYSAYFTGPFTTDSGGHTTYDLDDSGTNSRAAFRAEFGAIFTPIGTAIGKGAPAVALWPV